jgi:hypothetical protein
VHGERYPLVLIPSIFSCDTRPSDFETAIVFSVREGARYPCSVWNSKAVPHTQLQLHLTYILFLSFTSLGILFISPISSFIQIVRFLFKEFYTKEYNLPFFRSLDCLHIDEIWSLSQIVQNRQLQSCQTLQRTPAMSLEISISPSWDWVSNTLHSYSLLQFSIL